MGNQELDLSIFLLCFYAHSNSVKGSHTLLGLVLVSELLTSDHDNLLQEVDMPQKIPSSFEKLPNKYLMETVMMVYMTSYSVSLCVEFAAAGSSGIKCHSWILKGFGLMPEIYICRYGF